jgi:hypothetical protein
MSCISLLPLHDLDEAPEILALVSPFNQIDENGGREEIPRH